MGFWPFGGRKQDDGFVDEMPLDQTHGDPQSLHNEKETDMRQSQQKSPFAETIGDSEKHRQHPQALPGCSYSTVNYSTCTIRDGKRVCKDVHKELRRCGEGGWEEKVESADGKISWQPSSEVMHGMFGQLSPGMQGFHAMNPLAMMQEAARQLEEFEKIAGKVGQQQESKPEQSRSKIDSKASGLPVDDT